MPIATVFEMMFLRRLYTLVGRILFNPLYQNLQQRIRHVLFLMRRASDMALREARNELDRREFVRLLFICQVHVNDLYNLPQQIVNQVRNNRRHFLGFRERFLQRNNQVINEDVFERYPNMREPYGQNLPGRQNAEHRDAREDRRLRVSQAILMRRLAALRLNHRQPAQQHAHPQAHQPQAAQAQAMQPPRPRRQISAIRTLNDVDQLPQQNLRQQNHQEENENENNNNP